MTLQRTVSDWQAFREHWDGVHNFLMMGECVPFEFELPPVEQVIDDRPHPFTVFARIADENISHFSGPPSVADLG